MKFKNIKLKENVDSKKVLDIINRVNQELADKKLGIITKTFYRVLQTRSGFSKTFKTLAGAKNFITNNTCSTKFVIERITQKTERL